MGMETSLHMAVGLTVTILSCTHVFINRKRLFAVLKISVVKKLNSRAKLQYGTSLFLTITWSICVITGVLLGFPVLFYSMVGLTDLFMVSVVHILTAFLSLIVTIAHIAQHLRQIGLYFKKGNTGIKCFSLI